MIYILLGGSEWAVEILERARRVFVVWCINGGLGVSRQWGQIRELL
jgi:hypothetical protein